MSKTTFFCLEYKTRWGESLALEADGTRYPMRWSAGGVWSVRIPDCPDSLLADYGYVVLEDGLVTRYEWDRHHRKPSRAREPRYNDAWIDCPIAGCPFPRRHSAPVFDRPGWRGAGTAVPVFSLRSRGSFGVGEFADLIPLVDWAAQTGQQIIQLLPVNDTSRRGGWDDSYPYSPVSSFALHPIYLHLPSVGVREDATYRRLKAELEALPALDYPRVAAEKRRLLLEAFSRLGARDLSRPEARTFLEQNRFWLDSYAEFCARRDGAPADFYRWEQYHLDRQLGEAVRYAHAKGVYLKGDLPIGVGADSVDAASFPELFNLDSQAGAPPDFFSRDGQNWGFPTYNWEAMERDGYRWWRRRLEKMAVYFDAYRIDHILGFFRIWEIPRPEKSGRAGHFNPALPYSREDIAAMGLPEAGLFLEDPHRPGFLHPLISPDTSALSTGQKARFDALYTDFFFHRHNEFWRRNALRKLPALLSCTGMLACGEDLGMVPDCVPDVMEREKILSLEMQRMEKGRPWPVLSVCTTSSHDMDPLRRRDGGDLSPEDCRRIVREHLLAPSMLAILPLQDWLSLSGKLRRADAAAERINDPADPHNHWCWRMHLSLEDLNAEASFAAEVRALVEESGRL